MELPHLQGRELGTQEIRLEDPTHIKFQMGRRILRGHERGPRLGSCSLTLGASDLGTNSWRCRELPSADAQDFLLCVLHRKTKVRDFP